MDFQSQRLEKQTRIKNIVLLLVFALLLAGCLTALLIRDEAEYSDAERRPLATMPTFSYDEIANGNWFEDFEDYALDQFILRDFLRSVKAVGSRYLLGTLDNNDLYFYQGAIYKIEEMNENSFIKGGEKIESIAQGYNGNIYYSVIPDKNALIAEKSKRPFIDIPKVETLLNNTVHSAEYLDITELLSWEDYYATDLHWKQENLLSVADRLLQGMNNDYNVLQDSFDSTSISGFYGAYYGQAAMPTASDTLTYLTSKTLSGVTVTSLSTGTRIPLYNEDAFDSIDPYNLFVGGTEALIKIENPACQTGKKLYLFRDSFGSSLSPLLVGGYSEIYLIDLRYVDSAYLHYFMEFEAGNDMLFLYSTHILNQSAMLR